MRRNVKITLAALLLILVAIVAAPAIFVAYSSLHYYDEMNSIKRRLDALDGVTVTNIWGHRDIGLEEVTARLRVEDHGEIVLCGLSQDVFDYPESVGITEISGLSFVVFDADYVSYALDIGAKGAVGRFFPYAFTTEADVVEHYDDILTTIRTWPTYPKMLHFESADGREIFLAVFPGSRQDHDPIYDLEHADNLLKLREQLPWGKWSEEAEEDLERVLIEVN